jgi:exonuclease SbcC
VTLHLTHLALRNVRSYESGELDFGPGVTVVFGDVGSGKTSLFHAIEMALFGFAEVEAPYLVRHRSGTASVALTLSDGEHSYELARTFRRKTRRGREVFEPEEPSFRVDGALRTYSATEFRQRVIELLGFPDNPNPRSRSDLWRWAVYTPQERMREILREEEADARLETIRKALGLERYRLAADNAELLATALRARARSHSDVARGLQHFETDLAKAEADVGTATTALADAEGRGAETRRLASEGEELLAASEAGRRAREADQRELEQRSQEHVRLEGSIAAAERQIAGSRADAERTERAIGDLGDVEGKLADAQGATAQAEAALGAARAELGLLEGAAQERATAENARSALEGKVRDHDGTLANDRGELRRAEGEAAEAAQGGPAREPSAPTPRTVDQLTAAIAELRTLENAAVRRSSLRETERHELSELIDGKVCPRCHQAVRPEEFAAHQREAEAAAASAAEALRRTQEQLAAAEAERGSRERFDRVHHSWVARQELRERAAEGVARARQRLADDESTRGALAEKLAAALEVETRARARAAPYEVARGTILGIEANRDRARSVLAELERRTVTLTSLRAAGETARAHAAAGAERLAEALGRLREVQTAMAALRDALRGAEAANRAHAELRSRRDGARGSERSAAEAVASARERLSFAQQRESEANDGVAERRGHLDRSGRLVSLATFVGTTYRDSLLDLERRLLGRAQATFERSFSKAFSSLVEDPGLLARCGPSFAPFVEIDGEWTPAEALSGGERTALALAFRVALGDVVRASGRLRLDTILLDEPTDGFSPEQVGRMGELLRSLPWGQVLVVTHEASLASVADRSVRVRKDGGVSHLEADGPTSGPGPSVVPERRRRPARLDAPAPPAT